MVKTNHKERGKRGGSTTVETHGVEHMSQIGKMGGTNLALKRGSEYMAAIGRKGGNAKKKEEANTQAG